MDETKEVLAAPVEIKEAAHEAISPKTKKFPLKAKVNWICQTLTRAGIKVILRIEFLVEITETILQKCDLKEYLKYNVFTKEVNNVIVFEYDIP